MQNLWSSLLRSEIEEIIPSGLRLGASAYFPAVAILMLWLAAVGTAFGGSATWCLDPGDPYCSSCWRPNDGFTIYNWTPRTVPNGSNTSNWGYSSLMKLKYR